MMLAGHRTRQIRAVPDEAIFGLAALTGKSLGAEEVPFVPVGPATVIALGGASVDAVINGER